MSEEKMYAVKNDEGKYWSFNDVDEFWQLDGVICPATLSEAIAKNTAKDYGGHVVTLIEEPKKVVLTKEQAKIIEEAKIHRFPAAHISNNVDDSKQEEEMLMNAYVNGYTVAKENKYVVYKVLGGKQNKDSHTGYAQACQHLSNSETMFWVLTKWILYDQGTKFTEKEIADYGLQDCEKEEVTNDGTK